MKIVFALLAIICGFSIAHAEPGAVTKQQIQDMVAEFQASQTSRGLVRGFSGGNVNCNENGSTSSCVEEACARVGCSFRSETMEIAKACSGNFSGACLKTVCAKVGCNFKSETMEIINACRGNFGDGCIKYACEKVGCNFKSEGIELANACRAADGECVKTVCSRTGCSFKSEILDVIKSCSGQ